MQTVPDSSDSQNDTVVTEDCPVCGKKGVEVPSCPRCGAELRIFTVISRASAVFAVAAMEALGKRGASAALGHAERSWSLMKNRQAAQAACMAHCALHDYPAALRWYHRYRQWKR